MYRFSLFCSFIVSIVLSSCSEFIEPSLDSKKISLISPADLTESTRYNQTFWWEPINETNSYRVQIASPSFDSIAELVADTLVKSAKFSFTLDPGKYQWRVRAENSGSSSPYATRTLIIHESSIAMQQVQIKSPGNGIYTNQDLVVKWNSLYGANVYRLQVDTNNFANPAKLVFDSTTPNTEFLVPLSTDKTYQWRLRAEGDSVNSKWSAIHIFTYDATPPSKVTLLNPAVNQNTSKPLTFSWNGVAGAKKYELYLYKDDQTTPYSTAFPASLNGTSYTLSEGDYTGALYWKVRALDEAGNRGALSDLRQFTIQ